MNLPESLDPDFKNYLSENFIEPLSKMGFQMDSYALTKEEDNWRGTHNIIFSHDDKTEIDWEELKKICTQDDDSQPCATYSFFFGDLFLYIPFSG